MSHQANKPQITVFHCINVFVEGDAIPIAAADHLDVHYVKLPCSSMVKDVFLMRAFEAGADVVAVLVCAQGACRYVEGNLRARKRVERVKVMLDDIGLDGRRLAFFHAAAQGEVRTLTTVLAEASGLAGVLGSNPAGSRLRVGQVLSENIS